MTFNIQLSGLCVCHALEHSLIRGGQPDEGVKVIAVVHICFMFLLMLILVLFVFDNKIDFQAEVEVVVMEGAGRGAGGRLAAW